MLKQAWACLAGWIAFGLLVEAMSGYRIPALLDDPIRREMLRLAHAHGTLLNLVLLAAAICARLELVRIESGVAILLRIAIISIPVGFLLAGVWHFKNDPGIGILLVPVGGVLLLWSCIQLALSTRN